MDKNLNRPKIGDIYKNMYLVDFEEMIPEMEEYLGNGVDITAQLFKDGRNAVSSCIVLKEGAPKILTYLNLTKDLAVNHFIPQFVGENKPACRCIACRGYY